MHEPRTYTGPTLGGGRMTVECPEWCVTDHAYWGDAADDTFHTSDVIDIRLPQTVGGLGGRTPAPVLPTRLAVHSTDPRPAGALILVDYGGDPSRGVDLDVAGVDALLGELDAYRSRLAALRNQLAALDAERRTKG